MSRLAVYIITFSTVCLMGLIILLISGVPIPGADAAWIVLSTFELAFPLSAMAATAPYNN